MNEAEQLRRALRAAERADPPVLDLDAIMRDGRRLRRRRHLVSGGAAALSVAALVGVVAVGVRATAPAPSVRPAPAASASPTTPTAMSPTPAASRSEPERQPVGEVVGTGIRGPDGDERVLYFVPVDLPRTPGVKIALVAGRRAPDGSITSDYLINDVEGSDRRPGFHQIGYDQSPQTPRPTPMPGFGYFVGPADRIVGTVDGREIPARLALWSRDTRVVVFWFDPKALPPGVELDGIVARDAKGRRL
ncbi:hypothetical protein ACIBTV_05735 [Micromonospora sp. NPDC049366]|uniref:hypothetical protein n=1 Tax=Micromonospora sp. NPDC049366 TaxID=3364271 RepID=UPI0037973945